MKETFNKLDNKKISEKDHSEIIKKCSECEHCSLCFHKDECEEFYDDTDGFYPYEAFTFKE